MARITTMTGHYNSCRQIGMSANRDDTDLTKPNQDRSEY